MKKINFSNAHRKKHFEFFNAMANPLFQVTASIAITPFLKVVKNQNLHFTSACAFIITKACQEIPSFLQRIRNKEIVQHDLVHPSFAIETRSSDVFSFCTVDYTPEWKAFYQNALAKIEQLQEEPSFEDEPGRDDFLFLSSMPWVSFTSVQHPTHLPPDSVPRIVWGKYEQIGFEIRMPLSIQAHHGLVDGKHMGQLFERIEFWMSHASSVFE